MPVIDHLKLSYNTLHMKILTALVMSTQSLSYCPPAPPLVVQV